MRVFSKAQPQGEPPTSDEVHEGGPDPDVEPQAELPLGLPPLSCLDLRAGVSPKPAVASKHSARSLRKLVTHTSACAGLGGAAALANGLSSTLPPSSPCISAF